MMLDSNYRMSKMTKIYLESLPDREHRSTVKKLFAEAEYHSTHARRKMSVKVVTETEEE